MDLADLRTDYNDQGLNEADVAASPFEQMERWMQDAIANPAGEWYEPTAMTLATTDTEGNVSARVMLLKEVDDRGLVFFTNYGSDKASNLNANPQAAICFYWGQLGRQVRVVGSIEKVDRATSEEYFATRPRASQLGAVASNQSQVVANRQVLEEAMVAAANKYEDQPVPTPEGWGGYRLLPTTFEFWQGRMSRLHDRLRYRLDGDAWVLERLSP
ncbi:pyridoxamine 5'-phosphate oxidase [Aeoliella mucimassa]|uniref:Pyridoxine/pyridoxamine 5'-phosphate oxidase n=1 Tax=Aeoliella mucimassa TaxID=2527972 RepID=A0A518AH36_9BACT|nr:pyridoxamine 5'-phosphate oxidase [Aeoliella mucimassa]QDU54045.1 Pyridoxine/pyridoxamine 5'-phosphate oxidase [Aeoliella mucimassa]